jgi:hypothetical protein
LSNAEVHQAQAMREHDGALLTLVKQIASKLSPITLPASGEERGQGPTALPTNDPAAAVRMLQARILPTQVANLPALALGAAPPNEAAMQNPTPIVSFILPLKVDGELWPARLDIRREEGDERESRKDGENAEQSDGRVWTAALDVISHSIGRISFRLALMPKEFVGTVHLSAPEAVEAAREEAEGLEERLRQAGLPEPRIIVSGGFGATESAGAQGADLDEYLRAD